MQEKKASHLRVKNELLLRKQEDSHVELQDICIACSTKRRGMYAHPRYSEKKASAEFKKQKRDALKIHNSLLNKMEAIRQS